MNCSCGGIIEEGYCCDCGRPALLCVGQILEAIRAHRRAGNKDVIATLEAEFASEKVVHVEKRIPVETIIADPALVDYEHSFHGYKRGKPMKVSPSLLIRARALLLARCAFDEVANAIGINESTLELYFRRDGTFKGPAMKRLRGDERCVPIRRSERKQ